MGATLALARYVYLLLRINVCCVPAVPVRRHSYVVTNLTCVPVPRALREDARP
jgi:hypothetical protein